MKIAPALALILGTSLAFSQVPTVSFAKLTNAGRPRGINISNVVVGQTLGGDEAAGFIIQNSSTTPLNVASATQTIIYGIENNGRIVGQYNTEDHNGSHGFLYFNGNVTTIDYPNALSTVARGINDPQIVVGDFKDTSGHSHGFSYNRGTFTQIDAPTATDTYADGINNPGDIVGQFIDAKGNRHGFLLPNGGTIQTVDVPFAGVTDTFVTGINASGIIVGHYVDQNGTHGFVDVSGVFVGFDAPDASAATGTLVGGVNNNGSFVVFGTSAYLAQVH